MALKIQKKVTPAGGGRPVMKSVTPSYPAAKSVPQSSKGIPQPKKGIPQPQKGIPQGRGGIPQTSEIKRVMDAFKRRMMGR